MKIINTKIKGLKIIKSKIFKDNRGFLRETFRKNLLNNQDFPFDIMSYSKKKCSKRFTFPKQKFSGKNHNCNTWKNNGCSS